MYVIKGLRLNKFQFVKPMSRRDVYNQLARQGNLRTTQYVDGSSGDSPYGDPVNFAEGLTKVDRMSFAQDLFKQNVAQQEQAK